jgi:hypothetical protein
MNTDRHRSQGVAIIGQSRRVPINTWLQPGELPPGKQRITVLTVFRAPVVTDALRVAGKPVVTQQVKDFFHKNLCSSVFICGFRFFLELQLPDLG